MHVPDAVHAILQILRKIDPAVKNGVCRVVVDTNERGRHRTRHFLHDFSAAVFPVNLQRQLHRVLFEQRQKAADVFHQLPVGGDRVILQVRFAHRGNDVFAAEKGGQADILHKVGKALRIHQIAVAAHRNWGQARFLQLILHLAQPRKRHRGKNMLRPALCRGQLNIMEARLLNARNGFLQRKSVVTVGICDDNTLQNHPSQNRIRQAPAVILIFN